MKYEKLNNDVIEVTSTSSMFEEEIAGDTYETRIKSDGKVEATDTITKPN